MRIGIVASLHHPVRAPFAGGLERHTHELAGGLLERGHDVVVFGAEDTDPRLPLVPIRSTTAPLRLSRDARRDVSMVSERFIQEHHCYTGLMRAVDDHRLDVLHLNSTHHVPVTAAGDVATPTTLTLHTPPTPWLESAFAHAGAARPAVAAVSRSVAARWSGVVTADRVIHNGVDLRRWRPTPRPSGGYAVWTGRLAPEKGTLAAVRACRAAGIPLRIAGPVGHDEEYAAEVVAALGPGDELVGHLDDEALVALVANADVQLVTPLWEEPYGLVVAEALACGTPVAAIARGGVPEIVDRSCARLAPPDDDRALAAAAVAATTLDRAACRRRAVEVADVSRMVDEYVALFAAVAAADAGSEYGRGRVARAGRRSP